MSAGHTPGPLWVEGSIYDGFAAAVVGRVELPGQADRQTHTLAHVRRLPDALLYAAAPQLLEACESAIPKGVCLTNRNIPDDFTVSLDCTMGDLRKLAAAIAKARGDA